VLYIVKRFRKPCLAMTEDRPGPNGAYEYLTKSRRQTKWDPDPDNARVFTNPGHAKTALQRLAGLATNVRDLKPGDEVFISRVVLTTRAPQTWIVS
jgi:hypothetical protein